MGTQGGKLQLPHFKTFLLHVVASQITVLRTGRGLFERLLFNKITMVSMNTKVLRKASVLQHLGPKIIASLE